MASFALQANVIANSGHDDMIVRLHARPSSPLTRLAHTTPAGAMDGCSGSINMVPPNVANMAQHDAVLDYYGRRLATCSSDKTIKIFEVEGDKHTLVETLRGYVIARHGSAK